MIKETTTIVNGKLITHKDVIFHTTTTVFSFIDRIRILFGKKVYIQSDLYTMNDEAKVVGSCATTRVERIFPTKRNVGRGLELNSQEVNHEN